MVKTLTNYIEEDWGDNSKQDRTGNEKGLYYSYSGSGTGNLLKGVFRPSWTTESSNGGFNLSNQKLQLNNQGGDQRTVCPVTTGSWEAHIAYPNSSWDGTDSIGFNFMGDLNAMYEAYSIGWYGTGQYYLGEPDGTKIIDSNKSTTDAEVVWRATRDSYSGMELFADTTSHGTAVSNKIPSASLSVGVGANWNESSGTPTLSKIIVK